MSACVESRVTAVEITFLRRVAEKIIRDKEKCENQGTDVRD